MSHIKVHNLQKYRFKVHITDECVKCTDQSLNFNH